MASRLPLPCRRLIASTASFAKWSLSCVRILLLSVVRAMFSRSCRNPTGLLPKAANPDITPPRVLLLSALRNIQQVLSQPHSTSCCDTDVLKTRRLVASMWCFAVKQFMHAQADL